MNNIRENVEAPTPTKCAKFIRVTNLATGGVIVAFGIVGIIFNAINNLFSLKFFLIFSPIFVIIFGIALLVLQLKPQLIVEHFGFLKTLIGRGIFNIYLSTQVYYYFSCSASNDVLAWISAMILFALGILYLVLHFAVGKQGYAGELKGQLE